MLKEHFQKLGQPETTKKKYYNENKLEARLPIYMLTRWGNPSIKGPALLRNPALDVYWGGESRQTP